MRNRGPDRVVWAGCAAFLGALVALVAPSAAEEPLLVPSQPTSVPTSQGSSTGGVIAVDRLLTLPRGFDVGNARKGGATRAEWRAQFMEARNSLTKSQADLAKTRHEIEANAADNGSWKMAPPGASLANSESPTSFRLTQQLRRDREEVKQAEQALTALDVEANIAAVPEDWRQ